MILHIAVTAALKGNAASSLSLSITFIATCPSLASKQANQTKAAFEDNPRSAEFLAWPLHSGWLSSGEQGGQFGCSHTVFRGNWAFTQAELCQLATRPKNNSWPVHKCRVYAPTLNWAQQRFHFTKDWDATIKQNLKWQHKPVPSQSPVTCGSWTSQPVVAPLSILCLLCRVPLSTQYFSAIFLISGVQKVYRSEHQMEKPSVELRKMSLLSPT